MIRFEILGRVQPKQRPRFSKGHTYTPKKTLDYEKHVRDAYPSDYKFKGQVKVKIIIFYEVPKSAKKDVAKQMLSHTIRPTGRHFGDLDNSIKSILDALNGLAYDDDAQVVDILARRYYDKEAKVIVELEEA
jgi:Holliday junction resolvase RusA-like endonuclease